MHMFITLYFFPPIFPCNNLLCADLQSGQFWTHINHPIITNQNICTPSGIEGGEREGGERGRREGGGREREERVREGGKGGERREREGEKEGRIEGGGGKK